METRTLVQQNAQVVRVVQLNVGDAYKRLDLTDMYGNPVKSGKVVVGVVTDILANGDDVAVTALEVRSDYSSSSIVTKTFAGGDDIAIYAVDEITARTVLDEAIQRKEGELSRNQDEGRRLTAQLRDLHSIADGTITLPQAVHEAAPTLSADTDTDN